MNAKDEAASIAWRDAALDLGIRVEAPFLRRAATDRLVEYIAFVPDFGSRGGMVVRSLEYDPANGAAIDFAGAIYSLSCDHYSTYDRHVWIDLLEHARWYGTDDPPSWYTAISPWHKDTAILEAVSGELGRIFGRQVPVENSPVYRRLDLLPGAEVLAFLARVPTGGVTHESFGRWSIAIAEEWDRRHPRRPSSER